MGGAVTDSHIGFPMPKSAKRMRGGQANRQRGMALLEITQAGNQPLPGKGGCQVNDQDLDIDFVTQVRTDPLDPIQRITDNRQ